MSGKNKHGVEIGQVWKDNDERIGKRTFKITKIDLDYYPHGRAECQLLIDLKKGQREFFWARLSRFNGTKRGYTKVARKTEKKAKAAKKKAAKKKIARKRG